MYWGLSGCGLVIFSNPSLIYVRISAVLTVSVISRCSAAWTFGICAWRVVSVCSACIHSSALIGVAVCVCWAAVTWTACGNDNQYEYYCYNCSNHDNILLSSYYINMYKNFRFLANSSVIMQIFPENLVMAFLKIPQLMTITELLIFGAQWLDLLDAGDWIYPILRYWVISVIDSGKASANRSGCVGVFTEIDCL